jgi:hypothetical protein
MGSSDNLSRDAVQTNLVELIVEDICTCETSESIRYHYHA